MQPEKGVKNPKPPKGGTGQSNIRKGMSMSHAEQCPVCKGSGKLQLDATCHGCDGKGWIAVDDKPKTETKFVTNPIKEG